MEDRDSCQRNRRIQKRLFDKQRVFSWTDRPADDFAVVQIDQDAEIDPLAQDIDVRQIAHDHFVFLPIVELTIDHVGDRIAIDRVFVNFEVLDGISGKQMMILHNPANAAPGNADPVFV